MGVVTKNAGKIQLLANKDVFDITSEELSTLHALKQQMERKLEFAYDLNEAIMNKTDETQTAIENECDTASDLELKIQTQLKDIERLLERIDPPEGTSGVSPSSRSTGLEMPEFDLPKFSGKYKDWIPFHDQFTSAVDRSTAISDIEKLNYLKACLKDEAASLLAHLPLTASNYRVGLKLLEDQYSNKRLILKAHLDAILQALLCGLRRQRASVVCN